MFDENINKEFRRSTPIKPEYHDDSKSEHWTRNDIVDFKWCITSRKVIAFLPGKE